MKEPLTLIGIDVGGTKIAAGTLNWPAGVRSGARVIPTLAHRGGRAVLDDVLGLTRALAAETAQAGQRVAAIGIGICELVDREGRLASDNCIRWRDLPVHGELGGIAPVVIEADVRAAALAESRFGAGEGRDPFLYVTVGTGISCCLVTGGRPFLGAHGATGTMASSPVDAECPACGHVDRRTLEEIASGPALVARYVAAGGTATRGHEVVAAAHSGDLRAVEVIRTAATALGVQVGLLVNVLDPAAVIVGGGLGLSEGPYWETLVPAIRRGIWAEQYRGLPILRARVGTDACWVGAALAAVPRA
jgi:glucokinase